MPPRPQEQLLIDCLPAATVKRILATSAGLAQFAEAAARMWPAAEVHCLYLDLYHALSAGEALDLPVAIEPGLTASAAEPPSQPAGNLVLYCATDFPELEADLAVLPLSSTGEAELTRDLMQSAHQRLRVGGTLMAATDNVRDRWLAEQMRLLFGRVERRQSAEAAAYLAHKETSLKKRKHFGCEIVFRDRERLIKAYTRPGVFAHRRVDPGSRHLMAVMEIEPGQRVLEIGCGSGAASLAAALRAEGVAVHAVDSSARAVDCVRRGAALNGLTNVSSELNATGAYQHAGRYDLALANPPYYANFRIARHFVTMAHEALAPGGRLLLVTKQPDWYEESLPDWYDRLEIFEMKGYFVVSGRRR